MSSAKNNLSAIILAAGKGTRMFSSLPKVLHTVCGLTLIERAIAALSKLALSEIVIVVGHEAKLVEEEVLRIKEKLNLKCEVKIAHQNKQLGTGHAAQIGFNEVSDKQSEILILPGDVPLLDRELISDFNKHFSSQAATISCLTTKVSSPKGYGRIIRDESSGDVVAIVEEKDCDDIQRKVNEINSAIYLTKGAFLEQALKKLTPQNAQGEYYLTDIVSEAAANKLKISAYCCDDSSKLSGANNRLELSKLEAIRRKELVEDLQLNGVTFEDPDTTFIDEDVAIQPDVYIGAGCRIYGRSSIGTGSRIEGDTFIKSSSIGTNVTVKPFCYVDNTIIGPSSQVGPSAHLRPGSVLEEHVKIGNFVETKSAVLRKGAKANHLSYLGDAEVGENANVGAGTITCNYDGVKKSKTSIGAGAFIGSNSALVAPVSIGAGSFVAAGSTITKNLPDGSLGVARSRQTNIENWSRDKKKG